MEYVDNSNFYPSMKNVDVSSRLKSSVEILIFDLDGVITSEKVYFDAARRAVAAIFEGDDLLGLPSYFKIPKDKYFDSELDLEKIISEDLIYKLKDRAINSNWDLTFLVTALHLIGVIRQCDNQERDNQVLSSSDKLNFCDAPLNHRISRFGREIKALEVELTHSVVIINKFLDQTSSIQGSDIIQFVSCFAEQILGKQFSFFKPKSELWDLCKNQFQTCYVENELRSEEVGREPLNLSVLDIVDLQTLFSRISAANRYVLGIATGRPYGEAKAALLALGIFHYFSPERIVTNEIVESTEKELLTRGFEVSLGKPHPLILLKAIHPELKSIDLSEDKVRIFNEKVAFVGDSPSDTLAARRAGCWSIGVLTGVGKNPSLRLNRRILLDSLGCHVVLNNVLDLIDVLKIGPESSN